MASCAVGDDSPPTLRRAAEEAHRIGHGWVGSAHLLLGILPGEQSATARLPARHGLTCEEDDPARLLLALIDNSGAATLPDSGDVDLAALEP